MSGPACRICSSSLHEVLVDLGISPLANSFLTHEQLRRMEPFYPLCAYVCHKCFLVQLEEFESPEGIFSEYAYFSSFSSSWVEHARRYVEKISSVLRLGSHSTVIEIASNDGYLLEHFVTRGIPVLGIEPAKNVAEAAIGKGIPTRVEFFEDVVAQRLVSEGTTADLVIGNNVLAHVPNLHSFVGGIKTVLKRSGVATLEFPHVLELLRHSEFDTIYHEHLSYFSLLAIERLFQQHDLAIFDIEQLASHGGSLRIYAKHQDDCGKVSTSRLSDLRAYEADAKLGDIETYRRFSEKVIHVKCQLLKFLIDSYEAGMHVVGYGAPAKGNTLLNYCGVCNGLLEYTVDRSPHKQGKFLPGTHIPIYSPNKIVQTKPEYVLILPWNLRDEIVSEMAVVRNWGGRFVVPIPTLEIL